MTKTRIAATRIMAKRGTIKHMAAHSTLTFDGSNETHDYFSDLGLLRLWDAYQARLIKLDYWHGKYVESCPHDGQTFERWLLANEV